MTYFAAAFDEQSGQVWMLQDTRIVTEAAEGDLTVARYQEKVYYHSPSNTLIGGQGSSTFFYAALALLHGENVQTYAEIVAGLRSVLSRMLRHYNREDVSLHKNATGLLCVLGFKTSGKAVLTTLDVTFGQSMAEPTVKTYDQQQLSAGFSVPRLSGTAEEAEMLNTLRAKHAEQVQWRVDPVGLQANVRELAERAFTAHTVNCAEASVSAIGGSLLAWRTGRNAALSQQCLFKFPKRWCAGEVERHCCTMGELLRDWPSDKKLVEKMVLLSQRNSH